MQIIASLVHSARSVTLQPACMAASMEEQAVSTVRQLLASSREYDMRPAATDRMPLTAENALVLERLGVARDVGSSRAAMCPLLPPMPTMIASARPVSKDFGWPEACSTT